jgi:hypothetical protein
MIKKLSYKPNETWDANVVDPAAIIDLLAKEIKKL